VRPRWPVHLGNLGLDLSDILTLAATGHAGALFDSLRCTAGGRWLTDVRLELRNTGLTHAHWTDLCAAVGTLLHLRNRRVAQCTPRGRHPHTPPHHRVSAFTPIRTGNAGDATPAIYALTSNATAFGA
jgi:hypothetical protein